MLAYYLQVYYKGGCDLFGALVINTLDSDIDIAVCITFLH